MKRTALLSSLLAFLWAAPVAAQDIESEMDAALADKPAPAVAEPAPAVQPDAAPGEPAPAPVAAPLPQIGDEDQLAVFVLQRGFYLSSDLGVFMTFGGVRGYSNVQPFLSIKAGYDIGNYISVQLALSSGYASGNALSMNDAPGTTGQQVQNYGLFNAGLEVVGALRPTKRFAIEPKLGGGITLINPQPTDPNDVALVVQSPAPHIAFGVDLKYLTLLTDFTAGVSLSGYYVVGPNIIGAAAAFVVRYTF